MKNIVVKMEESGNKNIMLCERGSTFGYNNMVVDMRSLLEMRKFNYPVVFDVTHSVQKPGGLGTATSGDREYVYPLLRAGLAIGVDAIFAEVHPNPAEAKSDGPNMLYLKDLEERKKIPKEAMEFFSSLKKTPIQIDKTNLLPSKVDIVIEIDQGEILYDIFDNYVEISQENIEESLEDKELERYLKQRARRFVEAINLRRKFMKELTKIVVERQQDFFLKDKPLKSLMLKDVAGEFGISISTVSRLVNSKYVKTPKGVFKLRSFFVRESVSSKSQEEILNMIKKLIQNEETVYTDKDIEEILRNYGINISRRTVAKYRAKLGIGSSRKR